MIKRHLFLAFLLILICACNDSNNKAKNKVTTLAPALKFHESDLVINAEFSIGDVRRYGIFPDSTYAYTHPVSKKPKITTVLDLAEHDSIQLFFPKGFYKTVLNLNGRSDLNLFFDEAAFYAVSIAKDVKTKEAPHNIRLKGSLIMYDRLGMVQAANIEIDTVYIKTDITRNPRKMRSRGCHIYLGSKNISIKYLKIDDTGSGDERYRNSHAALALDGWRNNPEKVSIDELYIKSTDRHGLYLTGKDHVINEIIIDRFGVGDDKGMSGMQDANGIEYKLFSGIWINRCYNSTIGEVKINAKNSKGFFTANFDEGDSLNPVTINKFEVKNFDRKLPVRFAKNTGVVVKKMIK